MSRPQRNIRRRQDRRNHRGNACPWLYSRRRRQRSRRQCIRRVTRHARLSEQRRIIRCSTNPMRSSKRGVVKVSGRCRSNHRSNASRRSTNPYVGDLFRDYFLFLYSGCAGGRGRVRGATFFWFNYTRASFLSS